MEIKIVQELKPYSFQELATWINKDYEESKKIVESLLLLNILKKTSSYESNLDLEELLYLDNFDYEETRIDNRRYVFKYVGIVTVGSCCFFIYPKYILDINEDKQNNFIKFKQILEVIRKYKLKEQLYSINGFNDKEEFNLLSFTLELLKDYHENGIYSKDKMIVEENGPGEILWYKTINEQNVYLCEDTPVYLDLYTINDVVNEEDLFRRLHRCIISRCSEEIKDILDILGMPRVKLSSERLEDIGSKEYLKYEIEQEITQQYITSKQEVLYKMISYIDRDDNSYGETKISFVGTNSFNLVWEDVCSSVMDNCLNRTLSDLRLEPYENKEPSDLLIDIISKPKWKHVESGQQHEVQYTLIPDIVSISNGKLSIYDAKYYTLKLDRNGVSGQPGVGDVTKQYLYEIAYKKLAKKNNLIIDKNAFILPIDDSKEKIIGIASIDLFSMLGKDVIFNDIEVILKPCEYIFEKYLNGEIEQ